MLQEPMYKVPLSHSWVFLNPTEPVLIRLECELGVTLFQNSMQTFS